MTGDDPESIDLRLTLLGKRVVALFDLNRTEWRAELSGLIALAERTGSARQTQFRTRAAQMHMYQGDWDEAAVCLHQLELSEVDAISSFLAAGVAAQIALRRDDRATADRHLAVLKDVTSTHGRMRAFLQPVTMAAAWRAEADGQPERALAMLADLLDPDNPEYHHQEFLTETARLALAAGDRATAELASSIAQSAALASDTPMWATTGSICQAMLDDDPETLLIAAQHLHRAGERPFQAFVLQEAAALLARRGDVAASQAPFTRALDIYEDLGCVLDVRRIKSRLRPYGVTRGSRAMRRRVDVGWEALTPAEVTVATLVAQRESNPDIAARLFLSRRTVEAHVAHIFRKLQVRRRSEIAEIARDQRANGPNETINRPRPPALSEESGISGS